MSLTQVTNGMIADAAVSPAKLSTGHPTWDSSGQLGIGTATPGYALDVTSQARIGDGTGQAILRLNGASSGSNLGAAIYIQNAGATNNGIGNYSAIMGGAFSADMLLYVGSSNNQLFYTSGLERMRLDSSGNVGIGTSSPDAKLTIKNPSVTGTQTILDVVGATSSTQLFGITANQSTDVCAIGTIYSGQLAFIQNNTERMRIDSSGNLLVGTTSAILGSSGVAGVQVGSSFVSIGKNNSNSNTMMTFNNSNGQVGNITTSGTTTSYSTSSDYRLKENIQPMQNALGVVAQLNPVTYTWKADGSDGQGFIAHELQAVVPDCVTGEKDAVDEEGNPKYQGIDTSFLVATLTAAIQELNAKVDAQSAEIAALKQVS